MKSSPMFYGSLIPCNSDRAPLTSVLRRPLSLVSLVTDCNVVRGRYTFLYFHLVKEIVTFHSLGHGHDIVGHESG